MRLLEKSKTYSSMARRNCRGARKSSRSGKIANLMVQAPKSPNLEAQRLAMRKLGFLIGSWTGEARMARAGGETIDLLQTEEAAYKLDGLILVIEGVGRTKSTRAPVLQAFGIISYDDVGQTYLMRAFNDGRFLEAEIKLLEEGKGMT